MRSHERQPEPPCSLRHRRGTDSVHEHAAIEQRPGDRHRLFVSTDKNRNDRGGGSHPSASRGHLLPEGLLVPPEGLDTFRLPRKKVEGSKCRPREGGGKARVVNEGTA